MRNINGDAILVESNYGAWPASKGGTNYPAFRNLHFQGVVCDGARAAASIRGVPQQPVPGLTLENVSIRAPASMRFDRLLPAAELSAGWRRWAAEDELTLLPSPARPHSQRQAILPVRMSEPLPNLTE
jgi:hypothetical protein